MSAPIDINVTSATSSVPASYKGRHYGFIEKQIPAWYKKMRPGRQQELHTAPWQVGQWYTGAAPALRSRLHNRHEVFRTALDDLDAGQYGYPFVEFHLRAQLYHGRDNMLDIGYVHVI